MRGYLIGPAANLAGAGLSGLDLANAVLAGANLTSADLTGATVTRADFTGVTWNNTTCPDGTNSDQHVNGCFSPLGSAQPARG